MSAACSYSERSRKAQHIGPSCNIASILCQGHSNRCCRICTIWVHLCASTGLVSPSNGKRKTSESKKQRVDQQWFFTGQVTGSWGLCLCTAPGEAWLRECNSRVRIFGPDRLLLHKMLVLFPGLRDSRKVLQRPKWGKPTSFSTHRWACPLVPSSAGMQHLWGPQVGCPGWLATGKEHTETHTGLSSIFATTFGHASPETLGANSLSLCICAASSHGMMVHPRAANAYWRAKSDEYISFEYFSPK